MIPAPGPVNCQITRRADGSRACGTHGVEWPAGTPDENVRAHIRDANQQWHRQQDALEKLTGNRETPSSERHAVQVDVRMDRNQLLALLDQLDGLREAVLALSARGKEEHHRKRSSSLASQSYARLEEDDE